MYYNLLLKKMLKFLFNFFFWLSRVFITADLRCSLWDLSLQWEGFSLVMVQGLSRYGVWACPTLCGILVSLTSDQTWVPYIGSLES